MSKVSFGQSNSVLVQVQRSEDRRIWNMDVDARNRQKLAQRNARRLLNKQRDEVNAAKAAQ